MAEDKVPDITVSIVSYNTRDLVQACLKSLCAREDEVTLEIIVVDNGSTDGSVEMVQDQFPTARVLPSGGNVGYGRANNLGFEKARGRYFFILNSDTEVLPGALSTLMQWMDTHPAAGACGPQLISPSGEMQTTWYRDPNLTSVWVEQTFLDRLPLFNRLAFDYGAKLQKQKEPREVQQITGAALMVRREVFGKVGGFDPAFFMYYEDTDLCIRIRATGQKIYYLPFARIYHHLGASSKTPQIRARMIASYNQSRYYYFNRYKGKSRAALLKSFVIAGALLRLFVWSLIALLKPQARSQVRLFREVVRLTWKMSLEIEQP